MRMDFITFRSVTPAQRGQRALQQEGIFCGLQRTPGYMEQRGCGYCLRIRSEDTARAVTSLRQQRIPFSKVYRSTDDGMEELVL